MTAYSFTSCIGAFALLVFLIAAVTKLGYACKAKQPIFGNRKVRYGQPPWLLDIYPLFGPQRDPRPKTPEERRRTRIRVLAWGLSLALCLCLVPLNFCPRYCLTTDNTIVRYDALNRPDDTVYTHHEFSHLYICGTHHTNHKGPTTYSFSMILEMEDGENFYFDYQYFRESELSPAETAIRVMEAMKSQFSREDISIEGIEYLPDIVRDRGLNAREAKLLYELFEVNPNG